MHNEHADAPPKFDVGAQKGGFTKTGTGWVPSGTSEPSPVMPTADPNYLYSPGVIAKINPTSPIEYQQPTQPLLVQTEQGAAIVAAPAQNEIHRAAPDILQAVLPMDQRAYSKHAIPALNIQGLPDDKDKKEGLPLVTAGFNPGGKELFYIAVGVVVLFILSKISAHA